ncbi:glutathione peroxidase [Alicyclobacillus shizuokensis]|uniref:glutathione peroxidase n=1 Tax=Alicyclobacillus shizuokensis TaxID=392014 RepID=UPI000834A2B3|nr:glutathione peroxidase [Alicyclobacillus shizuokensis]
MSVYDFTVERIDGTPQSLSDYRGKVLLIVNVASRCGFTPQYEGLQALYEAHQKEGLEILGFPCNQFGGQEPGTNDEILQFCQTNYRVSFPMFAKIEVNGKNAHPLYQYLKEQAKGAMGIEAIKWNFTKFLVGRDGSVVRRYAPNTTPHDLEPDVVAELEKPAP